MARLSQQPSSQLKSPLVLGIILFSLTVGGVSWYLLRASKNQSTSHMTPTAFPTSVSPSSQSPSPSSYFSTEIQQFLSPDGTKKLVFRIEHTSYLDTYSVFVSDASGQRHVYSIKVGKAESLLPPSKNNWSPDTAYVFVKMSAPDAIDPLIFKTDGSIFPGGKPYLDVGKLLHDRTGYYVNGVVRWISNTQLELSVLKEFTVQPFKYTFDAENETFAKQGN